MKGNDPAKSLTWPHTEGPNMLPESVPDHSLVGRAGKSELPDTKCCVLLPGDAKKALRDPNQRRSTHATPTTDGLLEEDITKAELRVIDNPTTFREITSNAEAGSSKMTIPESVLKPSTSDQDEPKSDNDVPYFSDIEAMSQGISLKTVRGQSLGWSSVLVHHCKEPWHLKEPSPSCMAAI